MGGMVLQRGRLTGGKAIYGRVLRATHYITTALTSSATTAANAGSLM